MSISSRASTFVFACSALFLAACTNPAGPPKNDYQMGERVVVGQLTYNVVESSWKTQLGELFRVRAPQRRFLLVTLSVTNGGGSDISIPLLQLEDSSGKAYQESENGEGVDNWFGLLRNLSPAQTQQGKLLFDVGLTSYKLRVTDAGEPGSEKYAWISIPLRMDTDTSVQAPLPGASK